MQNYFSGFPNVRLKPEILRLIPTFQFALGVPQHDLDIDSDDERLELVYAVCKHLDGVIFTPSSLRDESGRILIDSRGECDADAVLPDLPGPEVSSADESVSDELPEFVPPTAERVARRALVLAMVSARGLLEIDAPEMDNPDRNRRGIVDWIESLDLGAEAEPEEWELLQRRVGKLDRQAAIDAAWRSEGLSVLAWGLELYPLPADDELVNGPELWEAVGVRNIDRARQVLETPVLRSPAELSEMQTHLLMFHWRMTEHRLRPQAMDFVAFSQNCWIGRFDIGRFRIVKNDLALAIDQFTRRPGQRQPRAEYCHRKAPDNQLADGGQSSLFGDRHVNLTAWRGFGVKFIQAARGASPQNICWPGQIQMPCQKWWRGPLTLNQKGRKIRGLSVYPENH